MVLSHPRQPTPRLLGQLLCDYLQSLSLVEVDPAPYSESLAPSDSPDGAVLA